MADSSGANPFLLIPVHNRKATTLACLKQLAQIGDLARHNVVVVDDGSTDGTQQAIQAQFPTVQILRGDGHLWWTGAIALGMRYAAQQGADICIWLNDDCHPEPGALDTLVQFMYSQPGAIAAPACQLAGTNEAIANGCRQRQRLTVLPGAITPVESVSGYCVGIPKEVWMTTGYPDARRFPHYAGDDTYTFNAWRQGFKVYLLGDAVVRIQNMQEAEHSFLAYIQSRFSHNLSWWQVFSQPKSRYYLPSQYFYHLHKYGMVGGPLFLLKLTLWLLQYSYSLFAQRFRRDTSSCEF